MSTNTCSCHFKEHMITEMLRMREECPDKDTKWVDLLFTPSEGSHDSSLCCLLTFLFYYGYCKECTVPLSAQARSILAPLMENH